MTPLGTTAGTAAPPFTPEQQRRFDEGFARAVAKYPPEKRKAALLAALHLAQDELGWLPEPAMMYVGKLLDVPAVRVREVATFYTMYRLHPVGRHHIGVCNSISCWAMGSQQILRYSQDRLLTRPGPGTHDGPVSLRAGARRASTRPAPRGRRHHHTHIRN